MRCLRTFFFILSLILSVNFISCGGTFSNPVEAPQHCSNSGECNNLGDRPVVHSENELKIATFNTHLFWDKVCDSGSCGGDNFEEVPSVSAYNNKLDKITNGIRKLEADIVLLQEIENESVINDIYDKLKDIYSGAVIGELGYAASVDTAILYKGKLLNKLLHTRLTEGDSSQKTFARVFLELQLAYSEEAQAKDEVDLIVFAAHFVSKVTAGSDDRRLAEALTARKYLEDRAGEFPNTLIVMGGDLNDNTGSNPINVLEESEILLRVASDVPLADQATYYYRGTLQALDHLFLVLNNGGSYIPKSIRVFSNGSGRGWAGSDHAALRAGFSLNR